MTLLVSILPDYIYNQFNFLLEQWQVIAICNQMTLLVSILPDYMHSVLLDCELRWPIQLPARAMASYSNL